MISKMNFESEWCRCGADMKKNRTALRDVLFIRELFICEVCVGIFSSEWCRCGADMKKPPMGST